MNKTIILFIVAAFAYNNTFYADELVTFFIKPYPVIAHEKNEYAQSLVKELRQPSVVDRKVLHNVLQKDIESGIFATYAGYITISNPNGQVMFPRKHQRQLFYFAITTNIIPHIMTANTIHHWEFDPETPTTLYKVEKFLDQMTQLYYWQTTKIPVPEDNIIPLEAIVIFAKPKYIYVPEGISITRDRPNQVLPDIYIKKGIKLLGTTLFVLNIRPFFGHVDKVLQKRDTSYSIMVK